MGTLIERIGTKELYRLLHEIDERANPDYYDFNDKQLEKVVSELCVVSESEVDGG